MHLHQRRIGISTERSLCHRILSGALASAPDSWYAACAARLERGDERLTSSPTNRSDECFVRGNFRGR